MSSELLLAAIISGSLGALVLLAALVCDIRGPRKQKAGKDAGTQWPKAA